MFAKLTVVILSLGACACALLQLRHERLHAASELVRIQLQIRSQDERLWKTRTEIARLVTPEQVREMAANIGPLRPLVPGRSGEALGEVRQASAPRSQTSPAEPSVKQTKQPVVPPSTVVAENPKLTKRERQKPR